MAENATLEQSIISAVGAEGEVPPLSMPIEETPPGDEKGSDSEAKTEESAKQEEKKPAKQELDTSMGLSEQEQLQARQLFAALKDPASATQIMEEMARRAGFTKASTKEEVKVIEKNITEVLKEALGPDLDYLAEKLGPAIETLTDKKVKAGTEEIKQAFAAQERTRLANEANSVMTDIAKTQFNKDEIPDDVLADMNKLMDKVDPKDMTTKEYIEFIYYSVAGRRGLKAAEPAKDDRIKKNRTDAPARLASEGGGSPAATSLPAKAMSLTDSIKLAIEAAGKE